MLEIFVSHAAAFDGLCDISLENSGGHLRSPVSLCVQFFFRIVEQNRCTKPPNPVVAAG
jgi:hypothetical protein